MTTNLSEALSDLARTQARRKAAVWVAASAFAPLPFLTAATFAPGSLVHDAILGTGLLATFAAILGRSWCTLYIGDRKVRDLVTSGPYSIVRNPLYVFSFLGVGGLAAQTGSLTIVSLVLLIAYAVFLPVVRKEEEALLRLHGARFAAYTQRVPRFLPRPSLWKDVEELSVAPRRWRRTVLDASIMLCLVPAVRSVSWLQSHAPDLAVWSLP